MALSTQLSAGGSLWTVLSWDQVGCKNVTERGLKYGRNVYWSTVWPGRELGSRLHRQTETPGIHVVPTPHRLREAQVNTIRTRVSSELTQSGAGAQHQASGPGSNFYVSVTLPWS